MRRSLIWASICLFAANITACSQQSIRSDTAASSTDAHTSTSNSPGQPHPPKLISVSHMGDFYPAAARRAGEEGEAIVNVCTDQRGQVVGINITRSTGYEMLDDAAKRWAQTFKFLPAMNANGNPVPWCLDVPLKFKVDPTT